MGRVCIPVELNSPGQVLACLGLLEACERLVGPTQAGFSWHGLERSQFELACDGNANPLEVVLDFLFEAQLAQVVHDGFAFKEKKKSDDEDDVADQSGAQDIQNSGEVFPSARGEDTSLPICLSTGPMKVVLSHWADGSGRDPFKGYAGNRSAFTIARAMLFGVAAKPKKGKRQGDVLVRGVRQLWSEEREALLRDPFAVVTPMKGSFNFDPRGAWTALDAGYSPNDQKHLLLASPLVEILAAWGLQHNRMVERSKRVYEYTVWEGMLDSILARVAFFGGLPGLTQRKFEFKFSLSGKNKIVNYAEEK